MLMTQLTELQADGSKMIKIQNKNFSVQQISESGQCFRMEQVSENRFSMIALGKYLELEQKDEDIIFYCSGDEFESVWKRYFDLDNDYSRYIHAIPSEDKYLVSTAEYGTGIRILEQDIWEMVITFIISQQNNIKRIRRTIAMLCEKYGEKKHIAGKTEEAVYYSFPEPCSLANATPEELKACNLGYRAKYLLSTANSIHNGEVDLNSLKHMSYEEARKELLKLCGVGVKVADCICLFGLHMLDAFPMDTHILQVFEKHYPKGFPFASFEGFAGVIQQYIFYYDLQKGGEQ